MMTIKKFSFVALLTAMFFVTAFSVTSSAFAQVTGGGGFGCTDCGGSTGGTTGGTTTGGGDTTGGGGSSTVPPVCNITVNKTRVAAGESFTVTWNGTPSDATFKLNGGDVAASDSYTTTFNDAYDYMRYVLAGRTASGQVCSEEVVIYKNVPEPVCDISLSATAVQNVGDTYTITWNGTPTTGTFKINNTVVADSGSVTKAFVGPNSDSFTMTGVNGAFTCTKTVTVTKQSTVPAPTCNLTPALTALTAGQSTRLTWTSTNAVTGSISNGVNVIATVDPTDTTAFRNVSPTTTTTYTMTVANSAGTSATCAATITVTPTTPTPNAPVCTEFKATPTIINRGESTVLSWKTVNATTIFINNAVGTQSGPDGSTSVSPTADIVYRMTLTNSAGVQTTCDAPVTVRSTQTFSCQNNVTFTADDSSLTRGDSTVLRWNVTGADSASINNGVSSDARGTGSFTVSPTGDITYTLTATKAGFSPLSCPVTVNVGSSNGGGGGGSSSPRCELTLSDKAIAIGGSTKLTWKTSNASDIIIKDAAGNVLVTTENKSSTDKKALLDGEMTLRPTQSTTYTITASRGSRDRVCTVALVVGGSSNVTITETRDQQPLVNGISLTQVPYTGFDAGPTLTLVFYALLVLWALYLAYVLVIRRNSIGGVALATGAGVHPSNPTHNHNEYVNHDVMVKEVTPAPHFVSAAPVAAVAATPATTPTVGYAAMSTVRDEVYDAAATAVENQAHAEHVLLSSEAMYQFVNGTTTENRAAILTEVIAKAKASYPTEDGWVVITAERMQALFSTVATTPVVTPTVAPAVAGNSSLAEAIVTGNIVAAYQLIGHRPMVALAEAASELDAAFRAKQGGEATMTNLMSAELASVPAEKLQAAILALTEALDGTYTNEAEAVKVAILKSVKAIA